MSLYRPRVLPTWARSPVRLVSKRLFCLRPLGEPDSFLRVSRRKLWFLWPQSTFPKSQPRPCWPVAALSLAEWSGTMTGYWDWTHPTRTDWTVPSLECVYRWGGSPPGQSWCCKTCALLARVHPQGSSSRCCQVSLPRSRRCCLFVSSQHDLFGYLPIHRKCEWVLDFFFTWRKLRFSCLVLLLKESLSAKMMATV